MNYSSPDLTQHPPRSPRARLGGYVILPRMLDKCRATLAGKNGGYHFDCSLDQRFLQFTGIAPEMIKLEAAKGLSDTDMLAWIQANAPHKHSELAITAWSAAQELAGPTSNESRARLNERVAGAKAAHREDIKCWFDYLDVDDYVTFDGKP